MPKMFHALRSCRCAAALILAREDRPLDWRERSRLSFHLRICKACPRFERQVELMRHALAHWRKAAELPAATDARDKTES